MIEFSIRLSNNHICEIPLHCFTYKIPVSDTCQFACLHLPVFPHFLTEITTATMDGESIASIRCCSYLNEMVSSTYSTDAMIEHVFALIHSFKKFGNPFLADIDVVHHLRPLLTSFLMRVLKITV